MGSVMKFDAEAAKINFRQKDTDDLVRIAFLEKTYLPEARALAKEELDRRGITQQTIDQVSAHVEQLRREEFEAKVSDLKSEAQLSPLNRMLRLTLAPYRFACIFIGVAVMALFYLNDFFAWGILGLYGGHSIVVGVFIAAPFLLVGNVTNPTREEYIRKHRASSDGEVR